MEIERKFLVREIPKDLDRYPHTDLVQGYLLFSPVVRVRKDGDRYYLTVKGGGMMVREEYEVPIDEKGFLILAAKCEGRLIEKTRYRIPYKVWTIELDVFHGFKEGLVLAEVEFASEEEARSFEGPDWFSDDVTFDGRYHNSKMARE
ncbi:MAG: CYTH domain-containing protein [Lachnospiraceae bacterium]|nr:CYTH domain-containing protein [Lachnospiraceae bacterium]